jgi:hypothetical protein
MFAKDEGCIKFLADETVKGKLASAKKLSDVSAKDYDAIFYVGGHGPVIDLAVDPVNIKLASEASISMRFRTPTDGGPRSSTKPARSQVLCATGLR